MSGKTLEEAGRSLFDWARRERGVLGQPVPRYGSKLRATGAGLLAVGAVAFTLLVSKQREEKAAPDQAPVQAPADVISLEDLRSAGL